MTVADMEGSIAARPYTVTGLVREEFARWTSHVTAANPQMAEDMARAEVLDEGGTLLVCAVFDGHHGDVSKPTWSDPAVITLQQQRYWMTERGL